jgi:hypothetical protein
VRLDKFTALSALIPRARGGRVMDVFQQLEAHGVDLTQGGIKPGYTYFTHLDDLKEGDTVIIEAPRGENGRTVEHSGIAYPGTVVEVDPPADFAKQARKWIVCKVDWDAHRARSALAPAIEDARE